MRPTVSQLPGEEQSGYCGGMAVAAPRERPILFKGEMVKAILDGRKTQTRRTVALREFAPSTTRGYDWTFRDRRAMWNDVSHERLLQLCPYGCIGDRLWVKETYQIIHVSIDPETGYGDDVEAAPKIPKDDRGGWWSRVWRATDPQADYHPDDRGFVWRSPLHMPRWASRIALEITEVRVQRLQEIGEDDARAEGVEPVRLERKVYPSKDAATAETLSHRLAFMDLWDSINGKRRVWDDAAEEWRIDTSARWEANPWVWALTFRRFP